MTNTIRARLYIGRARSRAITWIVLLATWLIELWQMLVEISKPLWSSSGQSHGVPSHSLNLTRKPPVYDVIASTAPDGRKRMTASFYKVDRDLFRAGPDAYNKTVWKALDHRLDVGGGIGPYKHSEIKKDGVVSPHLLVSEEE